jgi:hypothetical protein
MEVKTMEFRTALDIVSLPTPVSEAFKRGLSAGVTLKEKTKDAVVILQWLNNSEAALRTIRETFEKNFSIVYKEKK